MPMKTLEWMYHRKGCKTCSRADEFLIKHGLSVKEVVSANKTAIVPEEAMKILRAAEELHVTKGTRVLDIKLTEQPLSEAELQALIIGPSGKLRAPAIKSGKKLIVGFDEQMYSRQLT